MYNITNLVSHILYQTLLGVSCEQRELGEGEVVHTVWGHVMSPRLCNISTCIEGLRCQILGFCSSAVDVFILLGCDAALLGDCCLMF